ncbi:hypothetical protein CHS0354_008962 [Potamilus streckersoni]|uniref:EGF domain-specific O-linked N-acetylglucosamine transferase n=1 Tax=Potamilus streckersoni TaxID=2493646 RepID=A0AAE0WDT3_9BIVA|nr:hypothetical protein CHS0354_008962 [Potamilus streckersoni]
MLHADNPGGTRTTTVPPVKQTQLIRRVTGLYKGFQNRTLLRHPENKTSKLRQFQRSFEIDQEPVVSWLKQRKEFCDGNFVGYDSLFALLTNVIITPEKGKGRRGGENIRDVLNQSEGDEYYLLEPGYFTIKCQDEEIPYSFQTKDHLINWKAALKIQKLFNVSGMTTVKTLTVALTRYEYVNMYHTMTDFYNAFLMMSIFKQRPDDVTILWIDGHPYGTLDVAWKTLFGHVMRAGELGEPTLFHGMVWNILGYFSPLNDHDSPHVPYLEEFREFFLGRHQVNFQRTLNCSRLTIRFIWRRDYVAHPRNPSGHVVRKIKNEDELISIMQKSFPNFEVIGSQIDLLDLTKQLQWISDTDILVGMHGAGLSHTLFLQKYAALIELYPTYWPTANKHFRAMAQWRNIHYQLWQNADQANEHANHYTYIPPDVVLKMVHEMQHKLCHGH